MSYGRNPYGGVTYAAGDVASIPSADVVPTLAVEVAFQSNALAENPTWFDITPDVRSWNTNRGRQRELERFQPGRATIVLSNNTRKYDSQFGPRNWLTATQYSFEDGATTGWGVEANCTLSTSTAQAYVGSRSMTLTSVASGNMSVNTTPSTNIAATPGSTWSATVQVRAATAARNCRVFIYYLNSGGGFISSSDGVSTANSTSGWTTLSVSGTAPALTAFVRMAVQVQSTAAASEVHYVDGAILLQTDSLLSAPYAPFYGYLRPMKRIRIRETFNGVTYPVFDGFVDRWNLDYPQTNKDATATVTATDGFKPIARTDMDRSVYTRVIKDSNPLVWLRLDDDKDVFEGGLNAVNSGSGGTAQDGVVKGGLRFRENGLIVNDGGYSVRSFSDDDTSGTHLMGLSIPNSALNLLSLPDFSVELWFVVDDTSNGAVALVSWGVSRGADVSGHAAGGFVNDPFGPPVRPNLIQFLISNAAFSDTRGVQTANNSVIAGKIHHLVCTKTSGNVMTIYLNGVASTTTAAGASGNTWPASVPTNGDFCVGMSTRNGGIEQSQNWRGLLSEVAVYSRALSASEVTDHYNAGRAPWDSDTPSTRLGRVLDAVGWPTSMRELDAGNVTLQSAELGVTALEHAQKVAESEFGLLFPARDGKVRFVSRGTIFGRVPSPVVVGDGAGEVGYRDIKFDDGDALIRNRATISRLNGAAKRAEDAASIGEFGRSDYTLDGLLHKSDTYSQDYANLIRDEYKQPRRRVTSLTLGPFSAADAASGYPMMLGRELGDAVVVRHRPPGGGALFQQTCVIEGIAASGAPGKRRQTTWTLSPEFSFRAAEGVDVATLGYAQVTAAQSGITADTDLTGLSVTVTVGSGRRIRISGFVPHDRTVADGLTRLRVKEGVTELLIVDGFPRVAAEGVVPLQGSVVLTPTAGSHTYKLTLARVTGTGTVACQAAAAFPAFILVEDIGT